MTIQFFLQLNSALGLAVLVLLMAELVFSKAQRQSATIAIPVKIREDR